MQVFFFGVKDPAIAGHDLYHFDDGFVRMAPTHEQRSLPFKWEILDGALMPQSGVKEQGHVHHCIINGWTVLTMPDYTGDSRGGSNAAFVVEGVMDVESAAAVAQSVFPALWARIAPRLPIAAL